MEKVKDMDCTEEWDLLYVVTAESCANAANENHSTVGVALNDGVNTQPLYVGKEESV